MGFLEELKRRLDEEEAQELEARKGKLLRKAEKEVREEQEISLRQQALQDSVVPQVINEFLVITGGSLGKPSIGGRMQVNFDVRYFKVWGNIDGSITIGGINMKRDDAKNPDQVEQVVGEAYSHASRHQDQSW